MLEQKTRSTGAQVRSGYPGGTASAQSQMIHGPGVPLKPLAAGQISPKVVRRAKAPVAYACVNCNKKHLRCDNARPCRRCVQSSKEDSCRDIKHKRKGRPPLRPDEPSRRSIDHGSSTLPAQISFRPLQAQPSYDSSRPQLRPGRSYPICAQPSIQSSQAAAMGSFIPSSRQYGQSMTATQPPSPYMVSPLDALRSDPYQGGYFYPSPQEQMEMPPLQLYSISVFPRSHLLPLQNEVGPGMMERASLQLPPIRRSSERSQTDPALVQSGLGSKGNSPQEQGPGTGTTRQPDPKRLRMDIRGILGPKQP